MFIAVVFADHTISQPHNTVCHILDRIVVRDHNDRISRFLINRLNQLQNFLRSVVIKCTRRLIAQQDIRIFHDRTADCRSLLLTAGELIRQLPLMLINTQGMQKLVHIKRTVTQICAYLHIFPHRQIRDQVVHLKNIAQMLPAVK